MSLKSKIKVVFLGDQSTGKTSILTRFIQDKFEVGLGTTVGIDFMAKTVEINNQVLRMQFWDTAGQERFRSLIPNYLKQAAIAFLVFDVTNQKSFSNLPEWIDLCNQNMGEKCVIILLANKCDLEERQVSHEEALSKSQEYNMKYFQVSAKTGQNIKEALNAACGVLIETNRKDSKEGETVAMNNLDQTNKEFQKVIVNSSKLRNQSSSQKKNKGCC